VHTPPIPPHRRGRIAIVTSVEVGCDGRDDVAVRLRTDERHHADGEVVWSWPPGAEVKSAMFMTSIAGDGDKKAGPRGDHV